MPMLAVEIFRNWKSAKVAINLKGVAIGNGYLDPPLLRQTRIPYNVAHGILPIILDHVDQGMYDDGDAIISPYNIYDDKPPCKTNIKGPLISSKKNWIKLPECLNTPYEGYMSRTDVRQALHIAEHLGDWYSINFDICYDRQHELSNMKPQVSHLQSNNIGSVVVA